MYLTMANSSRSVPIILRIINKKHPQGCFYGFLSLFIDYKVTCEFENILTHSTIYDTIHQEVKKWRVLKKFYKR